MVSQNNAMDGSLVEVASRAAERASTRTLVMSALVGLTILLTAALWTLFGRGGQWPLPLAAGAVVGLAFGIGGLAHQSLRDELSHPSPDHGRVASLRLVQRACALSAATGAIVGAGRVMMGFYGSSFWN